MKEFKMRFFTLYTMALIALAGCSSVSMPSIGGVFGNKDKQNTKTPLAENSVKPLAGTQGYKIDALCPDIIIREGTGTFSLYDKGLRDSSQLRYQASITQTARSCSQAGAMIAVKIGVAGRVLSGPKGGAAELNLPLRIAVMNQATQNVVSSKLYPIKAIIEPPEVSVNFSKVVTLLDIPMPTAPNEKIIYIGFDEGR